MANDLYSKQNVEVILRCLVAQRRLYSKAKTWSYLPKGISLGMALVVFFCPKSANAFLTNILTVFSLIGWVFAIVGERVGNEIRVRAASIQQYIDREIYAAAFTCRELSRWSDVARESVLACEIAGVSDLDVENEQVRNWYSDYSSLDASKAVLCCQKENVRWDGKLRMSALIAVVVLFVVFVWISLARVWNCRVCEAMPILMCGAGVASLLLRGLSNLILDCIRLSRISATVSLIEGLFTNGCKNKITDALIMLQELIYENRCKVALIPNWCYQIFRAKWQKKEDNIADAYRDIVR